MTAVTRLLPLQPRTLFKRAKAMAKHYHLPPIVIRELNSCGYPWEIQKMKRHMSILIDGEKAATASYTAQPNLRTPHNLVAQLRRFIRQKGEGIGRR